MSKSITDRSDSDADLANVGTEELSSNQEAVPVPMFCGEAKFALIWLSDPFNQFTKDAPVERPGKK